MEAWIHLFSQFTSEALLLEALTIFLLITGYTAFWILRKRRFGSLQLGVPAGVVKVYLAQLINEAQLLRSQFFGLLNEAGALSPEMMAQLNAGGGAGMQLMQASGLAAGNAGAGAAGLSSENLQAAASQIAGDPQLSGKLAELQQKLTQQVQATEVVVKEKQTLEAELAKAKSISTSTPGGGAGAGANGSEVNELKKKIKDLEDRLAEYSVIEDDLANLKRLQQENTELRSKLGGGAATAAAPSAEAAPPAATEISGEVAANTSEEPKAADPGFENLVDQVEASLGNAEAEAAAAAGAPAPEPVKADPPAPEPEAAAEPAAANQPASTEPTGASAAKPAEAAPAATGKGDDDLLSEFEKMLNM